MPKPTPLETQRTEGTLRGARVPASVRTSIRRALKQLVVERED